MSAVKTFKDQIHTVRCTAFRPWNATVKGSYGSVAYYFITQKFDVGIYPNELLEFIYCLQFLENGRSIVRVSRSPYYRYGDHPFPSAIEISIDESKGKKFAFEVVKNISANFSEYHVLNFEKVRFLDTDIFSYVGIIADNSDLLRLF